jgi:hypothetical protein
MAERMKRGIKAEMEEAREILVRWQPSSRAVITPIACMCRSTCLPGCAAHVRPCGRCHPGSVSGDPRVLCQDAYVEENRALVDLLAKGRGHVQELQMAAAAFQPEDPNEAAMAHVSHGS